jgi:hypothetical protein
MCVVCVLGVQRNYKKKIVQAISIWLLFIEASMFQ